MMSASKLQKLYREHCIYLPAMLGWFVCSAALTSYNKVVFGENHAHFPCPLLLTGIHFLVQWVFSYTVSSVFSEFFGGSVINNMSWKAFLGEKSDDDQSYHLHLLLFTSCYGLTEVFIHFLICCACCRRVYTLWICYGFRCWSIESISCQDNYHIFYNDQVI